MLNYIWLGLVVAAVLIGGYHNLTNAPAGTQALVIYTTDAFAKTVTARALALPPR